MFKEFKIGLLLIFNSNFKKNKLILIGNLDLSPKAASADVEEEEQVAMNSELSEPRKPQELNDRMRMPVNMEERHEEEPSKSVIRRYFPETWIWNLHFLE